VNIMGSFAEFEHALILDRTRGGRRNKAKFRLQFVGSLAPYGYRYVKANGPAKESAHLELVPEQAVVVRQIFDWIDHEHLSLREVLARLTSLKLSSPTGRPRWHISSLLNLARNETYCGTWHYNKREKREPTRRRRPFQTYQKYKKSSHFVRPKAEWIPVPLDPHLRVVDREQWDRVQAQLDRNLRFSPRHTQHRFLLSGLVRCGGCGKSFTGKTVKDRYFIYRCNGWCKKVSHIWEDDLFDPVWRALQDAFATPELLLEQKDSIQKELRTETAREGAREGDLATLQEEITKEEERLIAAYRMEILSAEKLAQELTNLKARHASLKESWRPPNEASGQANDAEVEEYCSLLVKGMEVADAREKQELLREVIDHIVYDGKTARIKGILSVEAGLAQRNCDLATGRDRSQLPLIRFALSAAVHRKERRKGHRAAYM